jgi:tRNA (guanine-N7-)-methyltransferase
LAIFEHDRTMGRILKEYDSTVLKPEDLTSPMDFDRIFGRGGPVHVEIGSGKGTFLLAQAKAQTDVNFLGIEWANKYYRHAANRLGRWGLTNVRITRADAAPFLAEQVAPESVDCFHIYFPDPWPKKKHHKRRFFQEGNVEMLIRRLKPGGRLQLATDHADYFEQMRKVTSALDALLEEVEFSRPAGAGEGELTGTNYERKYIRDQRTIRALAFRRKPT